ncbi:hypothetical protein Zm00014a_015627 [Zea mays]|uniref:Uncharacterized protein n=1 Tax=Zea mays TaxID=4577 RepID=A0A3L6FL44_MAIZE|nr:hypothetical protein Zm00014a_015627 [Zea mays]
MGPLFLSYKDTQFSCDQEKKSKATI